MRGFHFVLVASVLAGTAMIECSNSSNNCPDGSICDDAGIPTVSGGGCDSSKSASQGGCAVDDGDGFFVAPTGDDTALGSKLAPFKTIGQGILAAAAAPLKPNVYVCAGSYPENLVIKNAPAGVALHGGFDCTSWAQANAATTVAPPFSTVQGAEHVLNVQGAAALVEGLTLTAPDTVTDGTSSVAALIAGSPGMTFRRATVTAGNATSGSTPTPLAVLAANSNGNSDVNSSYIGGASISCPCATDTTVGGQGGTATTDGGAPTQGLPVVAGNTDAGKPGVQGSCGGGAGANGSAAPSDAPGANNLGVLSANGWAPNAGTDGPPGGTAQGGGGGNWNDGNGLGGGGGACGGCGGKGGQGGGGGGASIAIAVIGSTLRIQTSTMRAGKAGDGGNGVTGQPGQPGGTGGTGAGNQCLGGNGGTGGNGGAGGGGAGGISVAIATASTTPDIDQQSSIIEGTAGQGGHDGTALQKKAVDGIAAALHAF